MWCFWPKKTNQKSLGARPARPKGWGHPTEPHFPSNCTSDQRGVSCNNYTDPKSSLANSVEEENKRTKTTWLVKSRMFSFCCVFLSLVFILHHVLRRLLNITLWLVGPGFCLMCWKSDYESAYSNVWVMVPYPSQEASLSFRQMDRLIPKGDSCHLKEHPQLGIYLQTWK